MPTKTFHVDGLTCVDCARRVKVAVSQVEGVGQVDVDHVAGTLSATLDTPDVTTERIAEAVESAGYALATHAVGERPQVEARRGGERSAVLGFGRFVLSKRDTTQTAIAGLLTLLGLALAVAGAPAWGRIALFAVAIVVGGGPVARHAFQEVWLARSLGINTLMVIAVIGAGLIGEWAEAAIVVVLFSLGEALEGYAAEQARGALDRLLDLAPPTALKLMPAGGTRELSVEDLAVGDRVLVRPGDRVGVDGVIQSGESAVDQAPITGESVPVDKAPGDQVFAGTINTTGALEVEVTHLAIDSTLSRMVALVREARSRQAPVQRFIDQFARVYTPAVAIVALLVAAAPPLVLGQPFWGDHGWLMRALQMLVIACPCALVISTPVSLVSAMTNAASRGVLIKGGRYLEALSRIAVFAFDKTGTLTEGRPVMTEVIGVCACGQCVDDCGLQHAAALEVHSSHPLAQALLAEAEARQVSVPPAEGVTLLSGRGIEGVVNGVEVTVGSHAHFDQHFPHREAVCRLAEDMSAQGRTVVMVRHDEEVCAVFGLADVPRASSRQVLERLKADWNIHTVMLTGDNSTVAAEVARQVGVDEFRAELLPEDKVSVITELVERYQAVGMVGDGVNDAPALAEAEVGIAMGGAGSDQAMETADVVLMGDDLTQLPFLVWLSRRTRGVVTANILLALGVKVAVFALAAAGLATLWMAIVADVGASLAVILNGLRLRRMRTS